MTKRKKKAVDAEVITDVAVIDNSPGALIAQGIAKGADLAQLQTVLDVQIKWEANEAKKAYNLAMAKFKENPPVILKDGTVDYTPSGKSRVNYNHSTLANVASTINKALSEHGLSATWRTEQGDADGKGKGVKVTCVITHELGHSEKTSLIADPDATGGKNAIQQVGSTVTYLQRYTILAMTGLATQESDDDGLGSEIEVISDDQLEVLYKMLDESGLLNDKEYMKKMYAYLKVEALNDLPAKQFNVAKMAFATAIKKLGETK